MPPQIRSSSTGQEWSGKVLVSTESLRRSELAVIEESPQVRYISRCHHNFSHINSSSSDTWDFDEIRRYAAGFQSTGSC